jgi:4a-hydroxytetrahydrobiopterin dehydratase
MEFLTKARCEACKIGAPQVTAAEMEVFLPQIPEWRLVEVEGVKRLVRSFAFKNFRQALDFTNRVGEIAEEAGHHPALLTEWGRVEVSWWSHKIKGLHKNDFIMAAKTDELLTD